jgi:hypothetical protein
MAFGTHSIFSANNHLCGADLLLNKNDIIPNNAVGDVVRQKELATRPRQPRDENVYGIYDSWNFGSEFQSMGELREKGAGHAGDSATEVGSVTERAGDGVSLAGVSRAAETVVTQASVASAVSGRSAATASGSHSGTGASDASFTLRAAPMKQQSTMVVEDSRPPHQRMREDPRMGVGSPCPSSSASEACAPLHSAAGTRKPLSCEMIRNSNSHCQLVQKRLDSYAFHEIYLHLEIHFGLSFGLHTRFSPFFRYSHNNLAQ